jgi:hypothetical protein
MAATLPIGIPTRNRASLLRQALHYATQQTLPCQVIVHDNASEDDIEAVVAGFPAVQYARHSTDIGVWPNFTSLAAACQTEWFAWLQDNDLIRLDLAAKALVLLNAARQQGQEVVAYCGHLLFSGHTEGYWNLVCGPTVPYNMLEHSPTIVSGQVIAPLALNTVFAMPPAVVIRTDVLKQALEKIIPDCDLFNERIYLAHVGRHGKVVCDPLPVGVDKAHPDQLARKCLAISSERERQFRMFVKEVGPIIEEGGWEAAYQESLKVIGRHLRQRWLAELHRVREVHPAVAKVAAEIQKCEQSS